jgi:hypothetical protein
MQQMRGTSSILTISGPLYAFLSIVQFSLVFRLAVRTFIQKSVSCMELVGLIAGKRSNSPRPVSTRLHLCENNVRRAG